jgi:hypothetical protein
MPDVALPVVEVDYQRRVVRRDGRQVCFVSDYEWSAFLTLFEAARDGRSCTVARLAAGNSALMFFSALDWLKAALEPLNLAVVQFEGRMTTFRLLDLLSLEEVTPL